MKKLWEFFEPRNKKEFFEILAGYEAQGFTVGIGEKDARLFIFNDNKFIVMLVKKQQYGKYDWVNGAWFVTAITHANYNPDDPWHQIQDAKTVTIPYPQKNIFRINVDPVDAPMFDSFIKQFIGISPEKRLKLLRKAKLDKLKKISK